MCEIRNGVARLQVAGLLVGGSDQIVCSKITLLGIVVAGCEVSVSETEELSGTGAAFMAGMKLGLWGEEIFDTIKWKHVLPSMAEDVRRHKYEGYQKAVGRIRAEVSYETV